MLLCLQYAIRLGPLSATIFIPLASTVPSHPFTFTRQIIRNFGRDRKSLGHGPRRPSCPYCGLAYDPTPHHRVESAPTCRKDRMKNKHLPGRPLSSASQGNSSCRRGRHRYAYALRGPLVPASAAAEADGGCYRRRTFNPPPSKRHDGISSCPTTLINLKIAVRGQCCHALFSLRLEAKCIVRCYPAKDVTLGKKEQFI